ncbi:MAG: carotenoid 1,2-hydratase [Gammaproteobacteria bacterium]|nr:carotenoid 1,2-hydratase [Gammaproteobacteria bacterium]
MARQTPSLRGLCYPIIATAGVLLGCTEDGGETTPGIRAALGGDASADNGFTVARNVREFVFPHDHGPHPGYRSEWWYLTAVVATDDDPPREFGVQFTLFRQGLAPGADNDGPGSGPEAWRTGQGYMAHLALSDVAARRHLAAERFSRGHRELAGAQAKPFRVYLDDWQLASASDGFAPQRLVAKTADFAVDLVLEVGRPITLQGEGGLSRKGPDNASYYYSVPRMQAHGDLAVGDAAHRVRGLAWMDREWSTSVLADAYAGWDWFAFHLDDGRDLMLYRLRRVDGRGDAFNSGSVGDGRNSRTLAAGDFLLTPVEHWRGWPVAWRLELSYEDSEEYIVRAAFEDQVMDTSVRYWEGVAYLTDDRGRRRGAGYMELTGY